MALTSQAKKLDSFTISYKDFIGTERLNHAVDKYWRSYKKRSGISLVWSVYIPSKKEEGKIENELVIYAFIEERSPAVSDEVQYSEPIFKVSYT